MKKAHEIPEDVLNSNLEYCINEYVRLSVNREILRDKWFSGMSFEKLAEKYGIAVTTAKDIVYDIGDPILIRASQMDRKSSIISAIWSIITYHHPLKIIIQNSGQGKTA